MVQQELFESYIQFIKDASYSTAEDGIIMVVRQPEWEKERNTPKWEKEREFYRQMEGAERESSQYIKLG